MYFNNDKLTTLNKKGEFTYLQSLVNICTSIINKLLTLPSIDGNADINHLI